MMFWKKRPAPSQKQSKETESLLQELNERFGRIEQSLDRLRTNPTQITIENIHIHMPALQKMEYRLDGLDIEQLSGSLNLGNNFGAKIRPDPPASKPNVPPQAGMAVSPESNPSADAAPGLQRTQTGFRLTKT